MEPAALPGKARTPAQVLLAGLLTFGIGFAWYYFQAFREVDRDAGRRHSPLFFLAFVPFLGPVFALAYAWVEFKGLEASRRAAGLERGLGFWPHAGLACLGVAAAGAVAIPLWLATRGALGEFEWVVPAAVVGWLGLAPSAAALAPTVNGYWEARGSGAPPPPPPTSPPA